MDAIQLNFFSEDPNNRPLLLSSYGEGVKNDCGVYVENVMKFSEGKLTGTNVTIELCAVGKFILFEFDYFAGTYGVGNPLSLPCHECHRANSAEFLAEMIFSTFKNGVVPYDKNLVNYPKETKELLKLCRKACDRIAK